MTEKPAELSVSLWRGAHDGRYETYTVPSARKSDCARRCYLRAAPSRSDAVLSLRVPGRHVRLLRDDRQRPAALDLPDACFQGRRRRTLEIGPLENLPVIKDLATDMKAVLREMAGRRKAFSSRRKPGTTRSSPSGPDTRRAPRSTPASNASIAASATPACDTVRWNADYLGPAALKRAWTLVNDGRDAGQTPRLQAARMSGGCHACHSHQSCKDFCPQIAQPDLLDRRAEKTHHQGLSAGRDQRSNHECAPLSLAAWRRRL